VAHQKNPSAPASVVVQGMLNAMNVSRFAQRTGRLWRRPAVTAVNSLWQSAVPWAEPLNLGWPEKKAETEMSRLEVLLALEMKDFVFFMATWNSLNISHTKSRIQVMA